MSGTNKKQRLARAMSDEDETKAAEDQGAEAKDGGSKADESSSKEAPQGPGARIEDETKAAEHQGAEAKDRGSEAEESSKKEAPQGAVARIAKYAKDVQTTLLSIVLSSVLIGTVVVVAIEFPSKAIVLDQIEVPKALQDKGITPVSVSRRLADQVQKIQAKSTENRSLHRLLQPAWMQEDIQVPGSTLSVRAIVRFFKEEFGLPDTHIDGELTEGPAERLSLTLRNTETGEVLVTQPRSTNGLDQLIADGATNIVQIVDPVTLAAYWYAIEGRTHSFRNTEHWIRYAIANDFEASASRAYNLWGNFLTDQGIMQDALDKYRLAAAQKHQFAELYSNWGDALTTVGRSSDAEAKYHKALEMNGSLGAAYLGLGTLYSQQANYASAIPALKSSKRLDPDQLCSSYILGSAYSETGNSAEAKKEFLLTAEKAEAKTAALEADLSEAPLSMGDIYTLWGASLARLGQTQAAEEKFLRAEQINPNNTDMYNEWGVALNGVRRFEEAVAKLEKATFVNPSFGLAYVNWGEALRGVGDSLGSLTKFERSTQLNPNVIYGHVGWAASLLDLGRREEAQKRVDLASQQNQKSGLVSKEQGDILFDLADDIGGNQKYATAERLGQKNEWLYVDWGFGLIGLGRPREAITKFDRALRVVPDLWYANAEWGQALINEGEYLDAVKRLETAWRSQPLSALTYIILAGLWPFSCRSAVAQLNATRCMVPSSSAAR
jgi:tetratricopeptide (TPR) repeat protein